MNPCTFAVLKCFNVHVPVPVTVPNSQHSIEFISLPGINENLVIILLRSSYPFARTNEVMLHNCWGHMQLQG